MPSAENSNDKTTHEEVREAEKAVDQSLKKLSRNMDQLAEKMEDHIKPVVNVLSFPQKAAAFAKDNGYLLAMAGVSIGLWALGKNKKRKKKKARK